MTKARKALERILAGMKKYPAVELRWRMTNGLDQARVEGMIKEIKERQKGTKGSAGSGGMGPGGRR
jgi:hypothetical protein